MRLFLAIPIDGAILDALAGAVDQLRETRAPVRWVRPEGMHLTLKFLGETDPDQVAPLVEAVSTVTDGVMPFPMSVHGAGGYPNLKRPRVLWAGVIESSGTLQRLVRGIEEVSEPLGWERERRKFSPHITIGRVKGDMNLGRLAAAVEGMKEQHWGDQAADTVVLYRSDLRPGGALYERLHLFPLGKQGGGA